MARGLFITFEGMDGCGKTTQMYRLARRLAALGREVVETAEPGGTAIGQQIRSVLLDARNHDLSPMAELLLYFASRAQNIDELIRPSLDSGAVVLADRFTDSSTAYQGYGRGLGPQTVRELERIACRGVKPDLTLVIDIDLETSLARARSRNVAAATIETRMDEQAIEFYERVRDAYRLMAAAEPQRFRVINGRGAVDAIESEIWEVVRPLV